MDGFRLSEGLYTLPLFIIHAIDKAGELPIRLDNREEHLKWAGELGDRTKMAGPLFSDDGETFRGSVFVVNLATLADARAWAATDPYALANVFKQVDIHPMHWAAGTGPD